MWLRSLRWAWPTIAFSLSPGLVLVDLLSATGALNRLKLFLVVSKSWVRLLVCAGERYWVPVLSKLYSWPLFSHWIRCLHGPTRAPTCCWQVPKRTRTSSRQSNRNAKLLMTTTTLSDELQYWHINYEPWIWLGWWVEEVFSVPLPPSHRRTQHHRSKRLVRHFVMWDIIGTNCLCKETRSPFLQQQQKLKQ